MYPIRYYEQTVQDEKHYFTTRSPEEEAALSESCREITEQEYYFRASADPLA